MVVQVFAVQYLQEHTIHTQFLIFHPFVLYISLCNLFWVWQHKRHQTKTFSLSDLLPNTYIWLSQRWYFVLGHFSAPLPALLKDWRNQDGHEISISGATRSENRSLTHSHPVGDLNRCICKRMHGCSKQADGTFDGLCHHRSHMQTKQTS